MGSIQEQSFFAAAEYIPPDSIFEVTKIYNEDSFEKKVNLCPGVYRDGDGKPWILPSIQFAKELVKNIGHEYLAIAGLKVFRDAAVDLVFHDTIALAEDRIASCQSLSGTGSLLLAGMALQRCNPVPKTVYITDPTWPNHDLLFASLRFKVQYLPYYKNGAFDFEAYMAALRTAEKGSIVVLHACAHNPTGCDPSKEQWKEIAAVVRERGLFPILDSAYLGFNSGSIDDDAWTIKYFVEELKMEAAVCMSFAKSMGLYGERIGLVAFITQSPSLQVTMTSILANCMRATVSTPPAYPAYIASTVLTNPTNKAQWQADLITMSSRIRTMREVLYSKLAALGTPAPPGSADWSHIVKQTGMFGYTGLTFEHVQHLKTEWHVYLAATGRVSIAGLNAGNVDYVAEAIDSTVRLFLG